MSLYLAALLLRAMAWWFPEAAIAGLVFNVTDFGAVACGHTDNSKAFLIAWMKACATPERSAIVVPKGDYLVHPLVFRGPCMGYMEVHIAGVLRAPDGLGAFRGWREWIHFASIDGLLVAGGGGTFDGRGATAWPLNECPWKRDCKLLPTVKF